MRRWTAGRTAAAAALGSLHRRASRRRCLWIAAVVARLCPCARSFSWLHCVLTERGSLWTQKGRIAGNCQERARIRRCSSGSRTGIGAGTAQGEPSARARLCSLACLCVFVLTIQSPSLLRAALSIPPLCCPSLSESRSANVSRWLLFFLLLSGRCCWRCTRRRSAAAISQAQSNGQGCSCSTHGSLDSSSR